MSKSADSVFSIDLSPAKNSNSTLRNFPVRIPKKRGCVRGGPAVFLVIVFLISAAVANTPPNGTIVAEAHCAASVKQTYEQYLNSRKAAIEEEVRSAATEGYKVNYNENFKRFVFSREEFERRRNFAGVNCRKITYISDGLKVSGFIWTPKLSGQKKLPLVIVNRGGNPTGPLLTPESFYYPFVKNGFVVIGSQYRGAGGAEGQDEFGGADVSDVLNLIPLARSLGYVDMDNVFVLGVSRGGMQTFLAIKKGLQANAVAVVGAATNLVALEKERPVLAEAVFSKLIPGYGENAERVLRERSAVDFAEEINVPVMILQGGADWRSRTESQALSLAGRLEALGKTYELHIYSGDNHPLDMNRLDREQKIVDWFKLHLKR